MDELPDAKAMEQFEADSLSLINDELGRRLDGQHGQIAQLDTKAGSLIAASVAVAGFVLSGRMSALGVVAVVANAAVICFGLASLAVRSWGQAPTPNILLKLEAEDSKKILDLVIRAKVQAFDENGKNSKIKSDWVKVSTWSFVVALLLTSAAKLL